MGNYYEDIYEFCPVKKYWSSLGLLQFPTIPTGQAEVAEWTTLDGVAVKFSVVLDVLSSLEDITKTHSEHEQSNWFFAYR